MEGSPSDETCRVPTREAAGERSVALLEWFAVHGRDLPWRHTRDPWLVLVSETMLAQTQVARVIAKYEAFIARFPTIAACAAAAPGDVLTMWSGLGYNRRALNLHRAARLLEERGVGVVPDQLDGLLALPGVGPYTARAVLAFAYERDVGVVDTNVARVVARWSGRSLDRPMAQAFADDAVPPEKGWPWNQAMLDFGALVCTARGPACDECPVRGCCGWAASGFATPDPLTGTAGTGSRQGRFQGSDRQGRGRLVAALRIGAVDTGPSQLAQVMGWPDDPERAVRVAEGVVRDGLAVHRDGWLHLP